MELHSKTMSSKRYKLQTVKFPLVNSEILDTKRMDKHCNRLPQY